MTVAIVTGASQGIGRAIALQLASDGMDVAVNDLERQTLQLDEVKAEILKIGRRAIAITADVTTEPDVERLVQTTVEHLGELNVFVANAGVISINGILTETIQGWEQVLAVNCKSVFLCYQKAAKQMIAQGKGGKLVAACSTAGHRAAPDAMAYSASKWAVRGLTQSCAQELAEYNITVNAYCPGPVRTKMFEKIDHERGVVKGLAKWQALNEFLDTRVALKRPSEPEDIAATVGFLAGPHSNMITGQSILIDGGINFS